MPLAKLDRQKRRSSALERKRPPNPPGRSTRTTWVYLSIWGLAGLLAGDAPGAERRAASQEGVALTVRVHGLSNERGKVAVALFASAEAFPDQKRAFAGQLATIEKGRAAVRFASVPPGTYAVAVLHDENQNSKMDFNFLGMPLEGYGFSNDASAPFGPPSFEAASFRLQPRDSFIPVRIRYFF